MALSNETIEMMLNELKQNQEELRKDYNGRIDKLEHKVEQWFESIKQEIKEQTVEQAKTFVSRVEFEFTQEKIKALEEDRKKLVWIVLTAVIGAVLSLIFIK